MTTAGRQRAAKAKLALALTDQFRRSTISAERDMICEELDRLFPDIRVRQGPDATISVYFLAGRLLQVSHVPGALRHAASHLQRVNHDGSGDILKSDGGMYVPHHLKRASISLDAFDFSFNLSRPPTAWERLDEDRFGD